MYAVLRVLCLLLCLWRNVVLVLLELELYKYIAEMDLQPPTWRGALSTSRWDRQMQDARDFGKGDRG